MNDEHKTARSLGSLAALLLFAVNIFSISSTDAAFGISSMTDECVHS